MKAPEVTEWTEGRQLSQGLLTVQRAEGQQQNTRWGQACESVNQRAGREGSDSQRKETGDPSPSFPSLIRRWQVDAVH